MNTIVSKITLCAAGISCIGVSISSSLLYMSHIAAAGLTTEISDKQTTIERRLEIAQGLDNAVFLQSSIANIIWWLSLVAITLISVVIMWGFGYHKKGK